MAEFYDTSEWNEKPWYQTGGTRSKVILENPNNHSVYFFKTSLKREKKDYKYEFWSEIVASEVGTLLGFNMLRYDIAHNRGELGCISKSMITEGQNKLTEGISYLTGYDKKYNPEDKLSKKQYTFQLICESLEYFRFGKYINNIIEIIILDSIIGNGDRHQENWGIITEYNDVIKILERMGDKGIKGFFKKAIIALVGITSDEERAESEKFFREINLSMPGNFSEIYDSGSCLGRELADHRVEQMLADDNMLNAYVKKGVSEIHWNGLKLNHFELIREINKRFPAFVKEIILRTITNYSESKIRESITNVDLKLPEAHNVFKLPERRKRLMIKLIDLRIQQLRKIIE